MHNLYNKIYEAVNAGIQKAIVVSDTQDKDVSVKYMRHRISGDTNLMPYYVDKLLNDDESDYNENYENITDYYKETKIKYKPQTFDELNMIYKKVTYIDEWVDTTKYMAYILKDGTAISIGDFNKSLINDIMLIGFNYNGDYFYLYKKSKPEQMGLRGAATHFCNTLTRMINFQLEAILPTMEELLFFKEYQGLINYALSWRLNAWDLDIKNGIWLSCDIIPGKRILRILSYGSNDLMSSQSAYGFCLPVFKKPE